MIDAQDVVRQARTWLGTPFAHQGRRKGAGVDCAGLLVCTLRELGIDVGDVASYPRIGDGSLAQVVADRCYPCSRPAPGVVAVIRFLRVPQHLALVAGDTMIHAYQPRGAVVEHAYDARWQRRTTSLWALPRVRYR